MGYKGIWHILLVGTSILRNSAKENLLLAEGYTREEAARIIDALRRCTVEGKCNSDRDKLVHAAVRLVRADPFRMSAELNGMRPWLEAYYAGGREAVAGASLLLTDTEPGVLVGDILEAYLSWHEIPVKKILVPRLGVPGFFAEGLRNLLKAIQQEAKEAGGEGYCPVINLTGGFKPESAIALVASIGYIPLAYYIHENFKDVVYIPLYPLADKRAALEEISKARLSGRKYVISGPSEWIKCLAYTMKPAGLAVTEPQLSLDPSIVDIIKVLAQS